jgi:hypothetical protein
MARKRSATEGTEAEAGMAPPLGFCFDEATQAQKKAPVLFVLVSNLRQVSRGSAKIILFESRDGFFYFW